MRDAGDVSAGAATERRRRGRAWLVAAALLVAVAAMLAVRVFRASPGAPRDHVTAIEVAGEGGVAAVAGIGAEPAYSPLADELHSPGRDEAHDLVVLRGLLGQLVTALRPAERPPLGDDADVAAALSGRNRRRIVFVPPTHPAIRDGRLVDRAGRPYHFHARSGDAFDLRSAGPDGLLFTGDDRVLAFGER